MLANRFGRDVLLERAAEVDLGFDRAVLATMLRSLDRFTGDELPVEPAGVEAVRSYFQDWVGELEARP